MSGEQQNIDKLRAAGELEVAIGRFTHGCEALAKKSNQVSLRRRIRQHLIEHDDGCLLLRWAAKMVREDRRADCGSVLDQFAEHVLPHMGDCQKLLLARLKLIAALTAAHDAEQIQNAIHDHVLAVNLQWQYRPIDSVKSHQKSHPPSADLSLIHI